MPPDCVDPDSVTAPVVERRMRQVLFKATESEKRSYVAASVRSGMDLSKWIRRILDAAAAAPPA